MRISLATRAACVCAAAALAFSLGLAPSFARMGGPGGGSFARPAPSGGRFQHFAPRGFNRRFDSDRYGFNRFGLNRFGRFGVNRFNRFGFDRFGGNQLLIGGWGWGWDGWGGFPVSTGSSEPVIVEGAAPVIINIGPDPRPRDGGAQYAGGCVTHKLIYDSSGKYAGEKQTSQC